ncbi:hypothetical protein H8I91_19570 [Serratia fonticola]|uniref:hypothetical protein n=1 Tax=Serratia fonticola TaxID=47917 RepID=UPI0016472A38|nr:hypothetical protein [Serratia fonticola]MBC3252465.1 hypothetical protein [Serratia fonticola]
MTLHKWIIGAIYSGMSMVASGNGLTTNVVSYPLYTLISDTLVKMVPVVNDRRNAFMMQLICDLARDDKTQKNVNQILAGKGIDTGNIPSQGNPLSLLVNGDKTQQQKVCLAYIATTLFYPQSNDFLFDISEGKDPTRTLNKERFAQEVKVRMAIAEATAQFYAVIASNIEIKKEMSYASYRKQIDAIAGQYAPLYFQNIKQNFYENKEIVLNKLLDNVDYTVIDASGRKISFADNSFSYSKGGVNWLGKGEILGKAYFIDIAVFSMKKKSGLDVKKSEKTRLK